MRQIKRKRLQPKERSSYISKYAGGSQRNVLTGFAVNGEITDLETGSRIVGVECKGYTQYYELMNPGSSTPTLCHKKKHRTIMVTGGKGFVTTFGADDEMFTAPLTPGSVVQLAPGVPYKISAVHDDKLDFFVVEESAYEARLESTGELTVGTPFAELVAEQESLPDDEHIPAPRTPTAISKAQQQLLAQRKGTKSGDQLVQAIMRGGTAAVSAPTPVATATTAPQSSNFSALGVNPQPTVITED